MRPAARPHQDIAPSAIFLYYPGAIFLLYSKEHALTCQRGLIATRRCCHRWVTDIDALQIELQML